MFDALQRYQCALSYLRVVSIVEPSFECRFLTSVRKPFVVFEGGQAKRRNNDDNTFGRGSNTKQTANGRR